MKQVIMGVVAAMAMSVMADNTVKVTKFHQSYPYSGKATIEYTVGGTLPNNAVAEIILNTDNASATFVQSNIVAGANSHVIDFASSFGGALLLTNASFVVTISEVAQLGGVQLWENGPYWAECNVGATKPPLQRSVCASCAGPCRIARELRAYSIHLIHSDLLTSHPLPFASYVTGETTFLPLRRMNLPPFFQTLPPLF